MRFSVGFDLTEDVRQAIAAIGDRGWVSAISQDGEKRNDAFVCELSLDLSAWPEGSRAICRRERAHPGAQLSLIDTGGWRHQVFITDLDGEPAERDRFHRARAGCEDRVRCAKDIGMRNLPFRDFDANEVWLELSLIAKTSSPGRGRSASTESSRAPSQSDCATDCCTRPGGSCARGGGRSCASPARGRGSRRSPPPSRASGRCLPRRLPDRPPPALTTADRRPAADQAPTSAARIRRRIDRRAVAAVLEQRREDSPSRRNHLTRQEPRKSRNTTSSLRARSSASRAALRATLRRARAPSPFLRPFRSP